MSFFSTTGVHSMTRLYPFAVLLLLAGCVSDEPSSLRSDASDGAVGTAFDITLTDHPGYTAAFLVHGPVDSGVTFGASIVAFDQSQPMLDGAPERACYARAVAGGGKEIVVEDPAHTRSQAQGLTGAYSPTAFVRAANMTLGGGGTWAGGSIGYADARGTAIQDDGTALVVLAIEDLDVWLNTTMSWAKATIKTESMTRLEDIHSGEIDCVSRLHEWQDGWFVDTNAGVHAEGLELDLPSEGAWLWVEYASDKSIDLVLEGNEVLSWSHDILDSSRQGFQNICISPGDWKLTLRELTATSTSTGWVHVAWVPLPASVLWQIDCLQL